MPPPLALALTLAFIFFLFASEKKDAYQPSAALWIPTIWMFVLGSRSVSEWVSLAAPVSSSGSIEDGSPLDRAVFFSLMVAGLIVVFRRQVSWGRLADNNIWLLLYFLYCGLSILWSDYQFVAFKRWTKGLGDPIMMLIILTDPKPLKAFETLIKRCAYTLLPLSVLFIKYYPHLGRTYSEWTGQASYTGVTTNKNLLGFLCMTCGLFFVWKLAEEWGKGKEARVKRDLLVYLGGLLMVGWLFQISDSKTSLVGLLLGTLVYFLVGLKSIQARVGIFTILAISSFAFLEWTVNITQIIITSAGRDATLTGRTELWDVLIPMAEASPWVGTGYESFWLGSRMEKLSSLWYWKPTQAHNGYLETYINLGWVGLFFLGGLILSSYRHIRALLAMDNGPAEIVSYARFGLAFLTVYLVYNITEGAFKSLHFLFVMFLILGTKYMQAQYRGAMTRTEQGRSSPRIGESFTGVRKVPSAG